MYGSTQWTRACSASDTTVLVRDRDIEHTYNCQTIPMYGTWLSRSPKCRHAFAVSLAPATSSNAN